MKSFAPALSNGRLVKLELKLLGFDVSGDINLQKSFLRLLEANVKTLRQLDLSGNCISHELVQEMTLIKSLQFTHIALRSLVSPDRF